jgi:RNA polymerase sigma-70 factor (ECF subfamily)
MIPTTHTPPSGLGQNAQFTTTHWSVVLTARQTDSPAASAALEQLCQTYWYPIYAFMRRQGHPPHDAEDLTQGFFERLLERQYLADVDRSKGRFRAFLIAALKHFLSDCRDRERAARRGGGKTILHLDALTAEERYRLEPSNVTPPDRLFDRGWALTVVENAVARLRQEYAASGKGDLFESLRFQLPGSARGDSYAAIASRLGTSESAIKSAASRLRDRFVHSVRAEVRQTVASVSDIDEEMHYLSEVWSTVSGE